MKVAQKSGARPSASRKRHADDSAPKSESKPKVAGRASSLDWEGSARSCFAEARLNLAKLSASVLIDDDDLDREEFLQLAANLLTNIGGAEIAFEEVVLELTEPGNAPASERKRPAQKKGADVSAESLGIVDASLLDALRAEVASLRARTGQNDVTDTLSTIDALADGIDDQLRKPTTMAEMANGLRAVAGEAAEGWAKKLEGVDGTPLLTASLRDSIEEGFEGVRTDVRRLFTGTVRLSQLASVEGLSETSALLSDARKTFSDVEFALVLLEQDLLRRPKDIDS